MRMKPTGVLTGVLGLCLSLSAQTNDGVLRELDARFRRMMSDWECPGMAVAVVKDDSVIFAKGYGVRELGRPELVDDNTLFAVGSQTKAFTAAALAILIVMLAPCLSAFLAAPAPALVTECAQTRIPSTLPE